MSGEVKVMAPESVWLLLTRERIFLANCPLSIATPPGFAERSQRWALSRIGQEERAEAVSMPTCVFDCVSVCLSWGGCEQYGYTLIPLCNIDTIRTVQFPFLNSFWNFDFYLIRLYCDLIVVLRAQHNGWTLWLFKHTDPWSHPGPIYTLCDHLKLFKPQYPSYETAIIMPTF